jgi:hypothetical protein
MRLQYVAFALALVGCARADGQQQGVTVADGGVDDPDASGGSDSGGHVPDDAPSSSGTDSGTGCTVVTTDLLVNGSFDGTGGWTEQPIDSAYPIITADPGPVTAQSGTNRAWMGGFEEAATDNLYQDVAIPASTTMLVLTGFYELRTDEYISGTYDTGAVEITTTGGTPLELVKALDDDHATTTWTPLDHTFTNLAMMKGITVRLHLTTTSDSSDVTSFFFDTLHLNATYCQ